MLFQKKLLISFTRSQFHYACCSLFSNIKIIAKEGITSKVNRGKKREKRNLIIAKEDQKWGECPIIEISKYIYNHIKILMKTQEIRIGFQLQLKSSQHREPTFPKEHLYIKPGQDTWAAIRKLKSKHQQVDQEKTPELKVPLNWQ